MPKTILSKSEIQGFSNFKLLTVFTPFSWIPTLQNSPNPEKGILWHVWGDKPAYIDYMDW